MSDFLPYQQPIIQPWQTEESQRANIKILVRREDQNNPFISGNKWWKLKYNLQHAREKKHETIVTFGGAFSNHIYATAAACKQLGLKSAGIIRGEEAQPLNSTLSFARSCGMELRYVSREVYRKKSELEFLSELEQQYQNCFIIPEGGTNELAIRGSEELGKEILKTDFDYCCLPVGTGGTLAGIINAFEGKRKIMGIPVLKDGGFLSDEIKKYLKADFTNWQLLLDYHLGGYAKTSPELNLFINHLKTAGMPTEFVYSGKLFWAVQDLVSKNFFEPGSTVLVLHSGGLRPAM
jgi:1-aminocyclopropane-1-carboxylate deaminase